MEDATEVGLKKCDESHKCRGQETNRMQTSLEVGKRILSGLD